MPAQHTIQVLAGNSKSGRRLRLRHWRLAFAMLALSCHSAGHVTVIRSTGTHFLDSVNNQYAIFATFFSGRFLVSLGRCQDSIHCPSAKLRFAADSRKSGYSPNGHGVSWLTISASIDPF